MWQRQQQMVSRFPKDWDILYIEPSFWLSVAWRIINKTPLGKETRPQENIEVVSVPTIPLADRFGLGRKLNDKMIVNGVRRMLRKRKISEPVLLFYKPRYSCVVGRLDESMVCYDVTDDTMEFDASKAWLDSRIRMLEDEADCIFTPSENMRKKLRGKKNVVLIGNGVDSAHFEGASGGNVQVPAEMKGMPGPVIGYAGAVGEWFDFDLLERILRELPDASVVIIGWVFPSQRRRLAGIKSGNLHVLGARKYRELPGYLKAFDVCIIPFQVNQLTRSVNPNKFYEYMASGKPAVTTELPEIAKYGHACKMAKDHDEFIRHLRDAVAGPHDAKAALQIARQNDWNGKAEEMSSTIRRLARGDQV